MTTATRTRKTTTRAKSAPIHSIARAELPEIGADLAGGKFAGVTLHDGAAHALVLLPGKTVATWKNAGTWAKEQGGELPSRIDGIVLFQNFKDDFEREWYWLGEQHAADPDSAWCQDFNWGTQTYWHKDDKVRARAVRRLPIQ